MTKPPIQAGFDYSRALLELRRRFTYDEIAQACGWESRSSVARILTGTVPHHPQGEALYILYVETFKRKPHP